MNDIIRTLMVRKTGVTVNDLADEYDVSRRTIYRDLIALQGANYPLCEEKIENRKYWKLEEDFKKVPPPTFTLTELMALRLSKNQLRYLKGTPFKKDFDTIFKKIGRYLPAKALPHLDLHEEVIFVHPEAPKDYSRMGKEISIIQQSLSRFKSLKMVYKSLWRGTPKQYLINPYALISFKRGLYILAYVQEYKELRHFAVERIKEVELTDKSYEIPEDFSIEEYTGSAFGIITGKPFRVKIEFTREVAPYIKERVWHKSQRISEKKDGRVILTMKVGGKEELISWILSFGPTAKVLEPKWLKDQIKKELNLSLKSYSL